MALSYIKRRPWKSDPSKTSYGFKFQLALTSTTHSILLLLKDQYGGGVYVSAEPKPRHKRVWGFHLTSSREQKKFLSDIEKYAHIKKEQIHLAQEYLSTVVSPGQRINEASWEKRLRIHARMRELNRRGDPPPVKNQIPATPPENWNPKVRCGDKELATRMAEVRASKCRSTP